MTINICTPKGEVIDNDIKKLKLDEQMLFKACAGYNLAVVKELLANHKLSANITNEERTSLLHVACNKGGYSIVKYLLENGATVNFPDCAGWTPLHVAVQAKRPYICYLLLRHGANISMQTIRKATPVDLAEDPRILKVIRIASRLSELEIDAQDFISEVEEEEKERERRAKLLVDMGDKRKGSLTGDNEGKEKYVEQLMNHTNHPMKLLKKASLQRSAVTKIEETGISRGMLFGGLRPVSVSHQQHP